MSEKIVNVAAGVLQRTDGSFLLAQRPAGKVYAGYWEFPGGKMEAGETPAAALRRELHEELGISALRIYPWVTRVYSYPHATVRLHFQRVVSWHGELQSREAQAFAWQRPGEPADAPMLPANAAVLKALELPTHYAITHAGELGEQDALGRLEAALAGGIRLVLVREPDLGVAQLEQFAQQVVRRCHEQGALAMVSADAELAGRVGADGVHLRAAQLMAASTRPTTRWCAASCHDQGEITQAEALGVDFIVLGPVKPTASHRQANPMGWQTFQQLVTPVAVPVYALGGMQRTDLETAWQHGAHGIAMMRSAWQSTASARQASFSSDEED